MCRLLALSKRTRPEEAGPNLYKAIEVHTQMFPVLPALWDSPGFNSLPPAEGTSLVFPSSAPALCICSLSSGFPVGAREPVSPSLDSWPPPMASPPSAGFGGALPCEVSVFFFPSGVRPKTALWLPGAPVPVNLFSGLSSPSRAGSLPPDSLSDAPPASPDSTRFTAFSAWAD